MASFHQRYATLERNKGAFLWKNANRKPLTLRRDRGASLKYWNLLSHIWSQIPVLPFPPVATGVSPAICRWHQAGQYLNFKDAPNFMKSGIQIIFWTRNTMESFIFDENQFLIPKKRFLYFRPNKRMATCWPPVTVVGPVWVSIIFYYQGWLLVQRASLGDFPFLRS